MSPPRRSGRRILKTFLPVLLLVALAVVGTVAWLLYATTRPPRRAYLVTPDRFRNFSSRGLQATDERWRNRDDTEARGWLLRGAANAPAVVLLHAYGADRSWLLNLGVKLNEATNYTVLIPDERGHGEQPLVGWTSFGTQEADDALAAINYLRTLPATGGRPLVGAAPIGMYGVEMGAYAALAAATREGANVRALALDSVPAAPDDVLNATVRDRVPSVGSSLFEAMARGGARIYFSGNYDNQTGCEAARAASTPRVLLLTGADAGYLRDSTLALAGCFPNSTNVETNATLPLTGVRLASATGAQGEAYDRLVITFFDQTLR